MLAFTSAELHALLAAGLLPFARIAALFSSAPLLSHRAFPVRLRLAAALAITAPVAVSLPAAALPAGAALLPALLEQVAVGLATGFAMQLVFAAAQLAGEAIGLQMGLGFASFFDPASASDAPLPSGVLVLIALMVLLSVDGHLVMIGGVARSMQELPPGALLGELDARALAQAGGTVFRTGLQLALAPLTGLLLVNLAFGLVARLSPQLNVFSVGLPASLLAGLALLLLSAPAWVGGLHSAMAAALGAILR